MKSIIREMEISKITGDQYTGDSLIIQEFFNNLFDRLEFMKSDKYPQSIFFIKNGSDFYMELDIERKKLYCSYNRIWAYFQSNFGYSTQEISNLIKYMVEKQLKEGVFTPIITHRPSSFQVEEQLKEGVFTPLIKWGWSSKMVEKQLKEGAFIPISDDSYLKDELER